MSDSLPTIQQILKDEQGNEYVEIGKYRIKVIKPLCIGASSCVAISPAIFKITAENIATFMQQGHDEVENIILAAQSCPTRAIIITDLETSEQIWPLA